MEEHSLKTNQTSLCGSKLAGLNRWPAYGCNLCWPNLNPHRYTWPNAKFSGLFWVQVGVGFGFETHMKLGSILSLGFRHLNSSWVRGTFNSGMLALCKFLLHKIWIDLGLTSTGSNLPNLHPYVDPLWFGIGFLLGSQMAGQGRAGPQVV